MKRILFILLLTIPFVGFGQGWEKTFGGTSYDQCLSVQQTTDGGYIVTGYTLSFGNNVYLIKTDGNGDSLWTRTFGGTGDDWGESVQQTTDGVYIITGSTWYFLNGIKDFYLIKTDENGEQQWSQTFGESFNDRAMFVQQTTDGGYIITGCNKVEKY